MTTTLVCGPPCSGKNTWVKAESRPGDLVVDLDAIYQALGADGDHDQPLALKPFAFAARDAVLDHLQTGSHEVTRAWIILSAPTEKDRHPFRSRGCQVVMLTADRGTLVRRAGAERPAGWTSYVDDWLARSDRFDIDQLIDTSD